MDNHSTSRKFIDLIYKASNKWANWNPPYEIKVRVSVSYLRIDYRTLQVGDYGRPDKQTGQFNREGNIYDDMHIYEDASIAGLVKDHPPQLAAREEVYIAASKEVKRGDLKLGAEMLVCLRNLSQDRTYLTMSYIQ